MIGGSSAEVTILPALHDFVSQALQGVPGDRWYTQPSNVVRGDPSSQPHAWFLADQRSVPRLPGSDPSPTAQAVQLSGVPPDPSIGPLPSATPTPNPSPCPPAVHGRPPPPCR